MISSHSNYVEACSAGNINLWTKYTVDKWRRVTKSNFLIKLVWANIISNWRSILIQNLKIEDLFIQI
jgi:hypothetical protein